MAVEVYIGEQRGDEGKGRIVDEEADEFDIVARFNGGNNAGHTVVRPDGEVLKLHTIPCGITRSGIMNIVGNGVFVNANSVVKEIADIQSQGIEVSSHNLMISSAAHMVLPHHILIDALREAGLGRQGSTQTGIAPVAASKGMRTGVRMETIINDPRRLFDNALEGLVPQIKAIADAGLTEEVLAALGLDELDAAEMAAEYVKNAQSLGHLVTDTVLYLNRELRRDQPARVLAEGAQAFWLDIDQGMYPFTTSSTTTSGGVSPGLGIAPKFIDRVYGVTKAVPSHVGGGPFVTEITDPEILTKLYGNMDAVDAEKGATTGRLRKLGHLDLPQLRRAQMVNGTDERILTKLDWVGRYGHEILVCTAYEINGERLDVAPSSALDLERAAPIYERLPGWEEEITEEELNSIRTFDDLPENAQNYIRFIVEQTVEQTSVPITKIGVGPEAGQIIKN